MFYLNNYTSFFFLILQIIMAADSFKILRKDIGKLFRLNYNVNNKREKTLIFYLLSEIFTLYENSDFEIVDCTMFLWNCDNLITWKIVQRNTRNCGAIKPKKMYCVMPLSLFLMISWRRFQYYYYDNLNVKCRS